MLTSHNQRLKSSVPRHFVAQYLGQDEIVPKSLSFATSPNMVPFADIFYRALSKKVEPY